MSEYIERGEAITEFAIRSSFYYAEWGNKRFTSDDVKEILQSIPAADVRPVEWTLCEEKQPPQGRYLCVKQLFNGDFSYVICCFAEDLSQIDEYDFPKKLYKGVGGWFDYDSETGYFPTSVYAWMPLPPFYNRGAKMEGE